MGKLFKKGYKAVREEKQRQDENRENAGKRLWRFFISKDGEEAQVRFLTEEPVNFYEHNIKVIRNGKEKYESVICTKELGGCNLCDSGDKPSFKGAFLLYDKRPFTYTDKNGKEQTSKGQLRLYVQGARVLSQLDRLSERYGLTDRDYIISRSGSGTSTTYMFDRTDKVSKYTEAEITNLLPEKLRESYDGTLDSLYEIVEEQLSMMVDNTSDSKNTDEDTTSSRVVSADDDDTPPWEDDDSETHAPIKSLRKPLGLKKPRENSVKPLFKKQ